jgi:colanic acid/amylovoran biosynthesis glycosyltransferase
VLRSAERVDTENFGRQVDRGSKRGSSAVCIACYTPYSYPVTFIRAHIELLPTQVVVLYGEYFRTGGERGAILTCSGERRDKPLLPLVYRLTRKTSLLFSDRLRKFLVANKVNALLAEFGPTGVAAMDACKEARVPLIVHFHGNDAYDPSLERAAYQNLFKRAASVVAVSREMVKHLRSLGTPPEKLRYNPYGVDTTLFRGGEPALAPPVFLAVGRFVSKKAPDLTLRAFSDTVKSIPEARLIMIGNGSQWQMCKQLARELGIANRVKFQGVKSHAEVAAMMRRVRAFVQHSRRTSSGQSEGTPNTVLEAGACGIPVIATRHAGIPDVVIDGETGLLVDEGDVAGMADHLTHLARDANLAARLGLAARDRICSEFSMEKRITHLWHIIKSAVDMDGRV